MKRTRHGEPEIRRLLAEAESLLMSGGTIPQACQKLGISEATFHRWRKKFCSDYATVDGEALPQRESRRQQDWSHRIRELEKENKRLKQLVGQLMLDNAFLKDALEARHRR
jgi:hypothetical protein